MQVRSCAFSRVPAISRALPRLPTPSHAIRHDLELAMLQAWYVHPKTFAILATDSGTAQAPYSSRGWPTVERAWAMLAKQKRLTSWPPILDTGSSSGEPRRLPPIHPDHIDAVLSTKVSCLPALTPPTCTPPPVPCTPP